MLFSTLLLCMVLLWASGSPDPNVNVNIDIDVNGQSASGGGGVGSSNGLTDIGDGIGISIENSCLIINYVNGKYEYNGKINTNCGKCEAWGDPHFIPFDSQNKYDFQGIGNFTMTQLGLNEPSLVNITADLQNVPNTVFSSARGICYTQNLPPEDIHVCVILPSFTDQNDKKCYGTGTPPSECNPRVVVNGVDKDITHTILQFKTVMIFEHNHHGDYATRPLDDTLCVNIVAFATGLSMALCMSGRKVPVDYYSNLFIWSMESNKGMLYGLCDQYTGPDVHHDYYTNRGGSTTSGTSSTNAKEFANTWKDEDSNYLNSTTPLDINNCKGNATALSSYTIQCRTITQEACKHIPDVECTTFNDACVYDLCRVSHPGQYAEGYANHMEIESHLYQ